MVSSLEEFPEWVHEKLQAQSSFTFGISCIFAGIILRQRKFLRTEDSLPISKLTFNLFFPALLCVKTWKTPLSSDLWPVGLVSFVVHLMICVCVFVLSGCIPIRNPKSGFRGQLILCLQGCNIGFTYPLVLASTHLAETVFPRLLLWDLCGNSPLVLFMNYIIAMKLAPVKNEEERRRILQESTQVPVEVIGATSDRGDQSEAKTSARPRLSSKGHIEESKQQLPKPKEPEDKGEEAPVSRSQADKPVGASTEDELELSTVQVDVPVREDGSDSPPRSGSSRVLAEALSQSGGHTFIRGLWNLQGVTMIKKVLTNLPFTGQLIGLVANLSGLKIPVMLDQLLESLGQPYSALFFVLLGLNLQWKAIRPKCAVILKISSVRVCMNGSLALLIWFLPLLSDKLSRKAAVLGLACPVGGISMSYVLEFGYNSSLQATVMAFTQILSFAALFILILSMTA
eukprot:TRINITY_DN16853_c0_g1_i3.p1 TRINITY_DN16853_c0_g1~~TRINITY_DN16853_c0_g1_i3.p1  ORF type:complete len:456 (-),score=67.39 TRINITY_DN16853_c0_g1_i3:147-1514(-)